MVMVSAVDDESQAALRLVVGDDGLIVGHRPIAPYSALHIKLGSGNDY